MEQLCLLKTLQLFDGGGEVELFLPLPCKKLGEEKRQLREEISPLSVRKILHTFSSKTCTLIIYYSIP
jgi:hypothetical protein